MFEKKNVMMLLRTVCIDFGGNLLKQKTQETEFCGNVQFPCCKCAVLQALPGNLNDN